DNAKADLPTHSILLQHRNPAHTFHARVAPSSIVLGRAVIQIVLRNPLVPPHISAAAPLAARNHIRTVRFHNRPARGNSLVVRAPSADLPPTACALLLPLHSQILDNPLGLCSCFP